MSLLSSFPRRTHRTPRLAVRWSITDGDLYAHHRLPHRNPLAQIRRPGFDLDSHRFNDDDLPRSHVIQHLMGPGTMGKFFGSFLPIRNMMLTEI